jgi:hypothetical protein
LEKSEKPAKESGLPIKLVVRRRGFEISTEGTISSITPELDALSEFAEKVAEKLEMAEEVFLTEGEATPTVEEVAKIPTADIPAIKPSKKTIDNLESLFGTPWGRTPRALAEIMKALEVNAVPDKMSSVNVYLTKLIQRGRIRRIEREGKWAYFKLPE